MNKVIAMIAMIEKYQNKSTKVFKNCNFFMIDGFKVVTNIYKLSNNDNKYLKNNN